MSNKNGNGITYTSKLELATSPGYWNASITTDTDSPIIEMDVTITLYGQPETRFWPYAIKFAGRTISFDIMDDKKAPWIQKRDELELQCVLFY
jgi:hypothetical protein